MVKISVIILTLGAAETLPSQLAALKTQTVAPCEIIVVDSSSSDRTVDIARNAGCRVVAIDRNDFGHAKTRNLGMKLVTGDIGVFLTQDAMPADNRFLEALCSPIYQGECSAALARQLPRPDASPIEKFSRSFNYPEVSNFRQLTDVGRLGVKAYFFSDSASALSVSVFRQVGGFEVGTIVNEDMVLCSKVLHAGYRVAYVAEAQVVHSHNYSLQALFGRYFDIGYFFYQAQGLLDGAKTTAEGLRYLAGLCRFLLSNAAGQWIPRALAEVVIRFIAFRIGYFGSRLPRGLCKRMSGQAAYWNAGSA